MPFTIPDSVFDKYLDVVDSTFNIFGVTCQLVYVDRVEEISNTFNNIPDNRSVNAHRRSQPQYTRQNKVIKEVEKMHNFMVEEKLLDPAEEWTKTPTYQTVL